MSQNTNCPCPHKPILIEYDHQRPPTPSTPHHTKRLPVLSLIPEDVATKPPAYESPKGDITEQRSRSHHFIPRPSMGESDLRDFRLQLDLSSDSDSAKSHPGWSRV